VRRAQLLQGSLSRAYLILVAVAIGAPLRATLKSHKRRKWDNGCPNCWLARATLLATDLCDSHFLDWLRVSAGFLPIGNGK
jgi:hypothetical protein